LGGVAARGLDEVLEQQQRRSGGAREHVERERVERERRSFVDPIESESIGPESFLHPKTSARV
jgi:hypothetical protein